MCKESSIPEEEFLVILIARRSGRRSFAYPEKDMTLEEIVKKYEEDYGDENIVCVYQEVYSSS